jgi:hypothetical protein
MSTGREFVAVTYRRRLAKQCALARFLGCSQATVHRIVSES